MPDGSETKEDRLARFKALKKRATESTNANRKELYEEHKKRDFDAKQKAKLERRKQAAEDELAKLEAEEKGEDYERKRAWDWTVEEVEEWDQRQKDKMAKKESSSDYSTMAERSYERNMQELEPDLEAYQKSKEEAAQKGLDVGSENGELEFVDHKPSKKDVEKLVNGLRRGDERRMKKRKQNFGEHVTYINEQNKRYTKQLDDHYNKYNKDVRDAFENGG